MSREHGLVDPGRLLTTLGIEARALAATAHASAADAPVPTCPGWTLGELVRHVASNYRKVLARLRAGRPSDDWQRDPAPGETLSEFFDAALEDLLDELAAHDPDDPADTWWPADPTYGFWRRRMLHETLIHRLDAEKAVAGTEGEVPEDLALDGVDEALTLWFTQKLPLLGLSGTREGTVGVRTGGHSWIARAGPSISEAWPCTPEEAAAADDVVTADPVPLYKWLWGRAPLTAVTVRGGHDQAAQLWALLRLGTR